MCNVILRKVRTASRFSIQEMLLILEAWLTLLWTHISLSILPYNWWRKFLFTPDNKSSEDTYSHAQQVDKKLLRLFAVAARNHICKMNCLRRSLALRRILSRRGLNTTLVLGARKNENVFEAHAWLQLDGLVLNDSPDVAEHYIPLTGLKQTEPALKAMVQ